MKNPVPKYLKLRALAMLMFVVTPVLQNESWAADSAVSADDAKAVAEAVDEWFVVLNAMLNRDPIPFANLYSHAEDTMYMGAEGTYRIGWDAIYADWQSQAAKSSGGKVDGVEIHIVVEGDMATAAHITKGSIRQPDGKMVEIAARETSVFRKEDGVWRMVAHHADGLAYWEEAFRN